MEEDFKFNQKGFSLIESLLIVVVIGSVVFLISNIPNALMLINRSKHVSLAREIAVKQVEDKRSINFSNLVNDTSPISDNRLNLLPQGSGTAEVTDCDPIICTNGENIKQIKVTLTWQDNSKPQELSIITMIGEGGINQ